MRLAIVADRWAPQRGGTERYLFDLTAAFRAAGHTADIYCQETAISRDDSVHTVPAIRYPRFLRDWSFCRRAGRRLEREAPMPILTVRPFPGATHYQLHAGVYGELFEAERRSLDASLRKRFHRHATTVNLKRQLLLRAQSGILTPSRRPHLMAVSRKVAAQLTRAFGIQSDQICVLYPGVDLGRFQPAAEDERRELRRSAGLDTGTLRLLFAGHNFVLKGLGPLLQALAEAGKAGLCAQLVVAGNGEAQTFARLARRLGVYDQVTFLGFVSQPELIRLYQAADLLVHPTFYDGCSLVALEALACGCPVITTRENGAAELIESGVHGLLLEDPRDIGALNQALQALRDPSRLDPMREAAARLGRSLDLKAHAARVIAWIESTTARKAAR